MTISEIVQIHTDENSAKKYIDPNTVQIIVDYIAELKHKTMLAEEQLLILKESGSD